jgi:hypothetical protein
MLWETGGRSIGRYQIQKAYWQDAVKYDKTIGGVYTDVKKKDYAEKVIRAYMNHYLKAGASDEQIARTHNGGPKGANNPNTLRYWNKVRAHL